MKEYTYKLIVEIKSIDRGQRLAQRRLHDWIETFGHTSVSHGFEFKTVGVLTGMHVHHPKREPTLIRDEPILGLEASDDKYHD